METLLGSRPRKRSFVGDPFAHLSRYDRLSPSMKRCRVGSGPLLADREISIDALPDNCLRRILERLAGKRARSISACVSRRWLCLLSTIVGSGEHHVHSVKRHLDLKERPKEVESQTWSRYDLEQRRRNFEIERATDVCLAAAAVGSGHCVELLIRGCESRSHKVTDVGLSAVARGFPSLRVLSLCDCPFVTDEGLIQIANNCPFLEELSLVGCSQISDSGIAAIARRCPKLSKLAINSCQRVGDHGFRSVGRACPGLTSISISDCPLLGDQAIAGLLATSDRSNVKELRLQNLNINDASFAVVGIYGTSVHALVLSGLDVTERGFWAMASAGGLKMLNSLTVVSCNGLTDLSLEAAAKGFPRLRSVRLRRCLSLSDAGLKTFVLAACSLENLQIECCRRRSLPSVLEAKSVRRNFKYQRDFLAEGCMGTYAGSHFDGLRPKESLALGLPSIQLTRHARSHLTKPDAEVSLEDRSLHGWMHGLSERVTMEIDLNL
ncbi:EIN3-binding F-box protein 1-like [Wolffia australiana]